MLECIYKIFDFPKYHRKNLVDFCPGRSYRPALEGARRRRCRGQLLLQLAVEPPRCLGGRAGAAARAEPEVLADLDLGGAELLGAELRGRPGAGRCREHGALLLRAPGLGSHFRFGALFISKFRKFGFKMSRSVSR